MRFPSLSRNMKERIRHFFIFKYSGLDAAPPSICCHGVENLLPDDHFRLQRARHRRFIIILGSRLSSWSISSTNRYSSPKPTVSAGTRGDFPRLTT